MYGERRGIYRVLVGKASVKASPSRQCMVCSGKKIKSSSRWECEVALLCASVFKNYDMTKKY